MNMFTIGLLCFFAGFVYSSFPEWVLHRYVMHRVFNFFGFKFRYPFNSHAMIHHQIFKADQSYELKNHYPRDQQSHQETIPMAWWNGPVLIAIMSLPFLAMIFIDVPWFMVISIILGIACYYCAYEYIHWCMHKPKGRWFERTWIYKWIKDHHRRHHAHMNRNNFNVVLPLADLCFGTLLLE